MIIAKGQGTEIHLFSGRGKAKLLSLFPISKAGNLPELSALQIMDRVIADRRGLPQVQRFMIYYLPRTIKLLHGCVKREDPARARAVLDAMVAAFHRQLNALYRGEVLDISADMARTEAELARPGLSGH